MGFGPQSSRRGVPSPLPGGDREEPTMPAKKSAFSLNALDTVAACNKPVEVQIKDVRGNPTPFFVKVLGAHSDPYRGRVRAMADEQLRQQATGKGAPASTLDALEHRNIDALVAATVDWRVGDSKAVELDGEELEFSADNARKVYERLLPVREQVAEAINDLGNFMTA